jgi:2-iminoacetate synthase ThiH
VKAGINDWGGVAGTPDHVNPEAPGRIGRSEQATERAQAPLVERLAIYPVFVRRRAALLSRGGRNATGQGRPSLRAFNRQPAS